MFEMNANVGDLKRVLGSIRCANEVANMFVSKGGLSIESFLPVNRFAVANLRSCGGVVHYDGDAAFMVKISDILSVLMSGRNGDVANIFYDKEHGLMIRIQNLTHEVNADSDPELDIRRSKSIESCTFDVSHDVSGSDFISLAKAAHDSASENLLISIIDSVFMIKSVGGKYVSYIKSHTGEPGNHSAKFDIDYLYSMSKHIRADDTICFMFTKDAPVIVNFGVNMWNIEYLVAPIIDYDGE